MMFKNQLAVAIKHNGKILRESKDLVHLPFGSEFSVLVKNLNSRRVKFTLHIDGTDVLNGTEIIVNANSESEIKRFIRNGNMNEGNAFKFIERTQAIEDGPRGIKVDDGIVRVEFWFEQASPEVKTVIHNDIWYRDYYPYYHPYRRNIFSPPYDIYYGISNTIADTKLGSNEGICRGMTSSASDGSVDLQNAMFSATQSSTIAANNISAQNASTSFNEAGITVPGSKIEQKFINTYGFNPEAQSHVIILRLAGKIGAAEVVAPVTVKTKNICSTCSHTNRYNAKFCSQCGTSLKLV